MRKEKGQIKTMKKQQIFFLKRPMEELYQPNIEWVNTLAMAYGSNAVRPMLPNILGLPQMVIM